MTVKFDNFARRAAPGDRGWVLYDGDCRLCVDLARRLGPWLASTGFELAPLQSETGRALLAEREGDLLREMAVVTPEGEIFGGAEACVFLARYLWWARPLRLLAALPGARRLLDRLYRWVADDRHCYGGACDAAPRRSRVRTAILVGVAAALPLAAFALTRHLEAWVMMWALAGSVFFACKLLTLARVDGGRRGVERVLFYFFLWPGMDTRPFFNAGSPARRPRAREWIAPAVKLACGVALLWVAVPAVGAGRPLLAGWLGMAGIVLVLHFGVFHLLALAWQRRGAPVRPLMEGPLFSASLAEFWGGRWNRAFSDLARDLVYRPLWRRAGPAACTMLVFLISGVVHDFVISVPARGGYGLPTLYFFIQGLGLLVERTRMGKRAGLGGGWRGRLFAFAILIGPLFWLFHPAFVERVAVPFLQTIGCL